MQIKRVNEAIEAIKNGEMIIIMDDESRENEADLVYAGEFTSPQKVNFLVTEAKGVLCVSITDELSKKLDFPLMVDKNSSNHETAFTISVDAKIAKTGVSAYERNLTIELICNDNSTPSDFVKPGHIFPLIAKKGGVIQRTGHTEASVDICKLAGLKPVAVICELMKEDGSMANNNDDFVIKFAKKHNMKILYVSDLVYYKIQYEQLIEKVNEIDVCFFGVNCKKINFIDHLNNRHIVYKFPNKKEKQNVRFHSFNNTLQLLEDGEFEALMKSIEFLKKNGGYLICMQGSKLSGEEAKDFGIGAQILKFLNINEFNLLLASKHREYIAIEGFGLSIKKEILV